MFIPKIEHIVLTVKNMQESAIFYKKLLVDCLNCTIESEDEKLIAFNFQNQFLLEFSQELAEFNSSIFNRYQVGLHHFGIQVENKEVVDKIYAKLLEINALILDVPMYYLNYNPNYYAVFFTDPNGFKIEFFTN